MRHLPLKFVLSLAAVIMLLLGGLGLLTHMQGENQTALHEEARTRAGLLMTDVGHDMKRWIQQDKERELERLIQQVATEPGILDVTLYDARGIPLAQSDGALPLEDLLPIGADNGSQPEQGKGRIQFVQEILNGDMTLGYLRITLEEAQLLAARGEHLKAVQQKQRLMVLGLLLAGGIISYGVRRNYMRKKRPAAPRTPCENATTPDIE